MSERFTFSQWIADSLRLRRVEYRIAELPIYLMPVLFVAEDSSAFRSLAFWEGLLVFLFLFALGDLINCLEDRDLDAKYKKHLADAVDRLGRRGVRSQALVSAIAAMAITIHLAWHLGRPVLIPMIMFGIALAWAYSAKPIHLKSRGLWQLAFYWLGLFAGPMLFAAALFQWPLGWQVIALSLAFGLMQSGVILVNTAEDFAEDREFGLRTAVIALGLKRSMQLAIVLAALGWISLLVLIGEVASTYANSIKLLPIAVGPLTISGTIVLIQIVRLSCQLPVEESAAISVIKQRARWVPLWITANAATALWSCGVLFVSGEGS